MKKTFILLILAMLLPGAAALVAVAQNMGSFFGQETQYMPADQKLRLAEAVIERYYVEEVDADTIVEEAIRAMLKTLDPHSSYTTADETKDFTQPLEGKFSGIGVQFSMVKDTVYVIQPTTGGPSEKVGIRAGDRIVSCNDTIIAGKKMKNSDIMKVLRGPKGTPALLRIKRGDQPELIDFMVIRDDIPIYSVDAAYMADPTTGYIRITRFAEDTGREVAEALDKLRAQGMQKVIIDLSDNGGGLLNAAFEVAELLLPEGSPVVTTRGLNVPPMDFATERAGAYTTEPLVLILNQISASASEILAGAVQDNDRGLVVGRRSFGKGLVQRPFPFPDGSMIRLTTSRYYTPSGRCIQKPYEKGHGDEYQYDMLNRYKSGELWSVDSIHLADSTEYRTLRNGRTVYGGGGILPDKFVPVDTSYYSNYYRDLVAKGVLNQYAIDWVEKNRATLKADYPTADAFDAGFEVSDAMVGELQARGTTEGVDYVEEQWTVSAPMVKAILKGIIARDAYDDGVYVRSVNPLLPDFRAALDLINDTKLYDQLLTGLK